MKPQALLAILGFGISTLVLFLYASRAQGQSAQMALVVMALAAWWLENQAVQRSPVDFSTGFLFYLLLAVSGDALGATLVMVAGYCVRAISGKTQTWDLLWLSPVILGLALVQSTSPWPLAGPTRGVAAIASVIIAAGLFEFGSTWATRGLRHPGSARLPDARIEDRQRDLRRLVFLYGPVTGLLPPGQAWMAAMVAPLCWALQRSAENIGYRVHAQEAVFMQHRVNESQQMLEETQSRLAVTSERQEILDQLTQVFTKPLSPTQAFQELARVTAKVVDYRSVVLFKMTEEQLLEPSFQSSPEADLLIANRLVGKREPLLEKAWLQDRAYRGTASTKADSRLLASESQLVAIPLKPAGVFYFGRSENEPFTKSEASKLFFVVRRAAPALLRAEVEAATQQAYAEQSQVSELLREKVALTSQLLEGAQEILAAVSPEQIYVALENLVCRAVPHEFGVVLVGDDFNRVRRWGRSGMQKEAVLCIADVAKSKARPMYLADMSTSSLPSPGDDIDSILAVPLFGEQQFLGILLIGATGRQAFSDEQHDFICTCACLAGSGLTSLGLFSRLQTAHQQVVQASKLSAIGRLAASVAHELNTPLAAIGLALEAVALRPEKAGEKLNRASKALDRAREIVSGLLDHARHSGSERTLLAVPDVFKGALELVGPQLIKKKIQVTTECAGELDRILANMTDLQQVLINLMLNAADASVGNSGIRLYANQTDSTIEIGVQDWGSGIASEHQDNVFDPFFTTKAVGLGTGLGLSVCRQLVERHQGRIDYVTAPGEGTTFRAKFPARQGSGAVVAPS